MSKKRRKDPDYQLMSTARWIVSSGAQEVMNKLEKKRARKQAWFKRQSN